MHCLMAAWKDNGIRRLLAPAVVIPIDPAFRRIAQQVCRANNRRQPLQLIGRHSVRILEDLDDSLDTLDLLNDPGDLIAILACYPSQQIGHRVFCDYFDVQG